VNALIIATAAIDFARNIHWPATSPLRRVLIVIIPLVVFNIGTQIWLGARFAPRDFSAYQAQVKQHVPPGTHVMADPVLWFAFNQRNTFTSDWYWYIGSGLREEPGLSAQIGASMREKEIAYAVDDGTLACIEQPTPFSEAYSTYLQSACNPVATIEDRFFGAYGHTGQGQPTIIYDCTAAHLPDSD
jgi:hypothetical protein